jgi:hypothetical protein
LLYLFAVHKLLGFLQNFHRMVEHRSTTSSLSETSTSKICLDPLIDSFANAILNCWYPETPAF